MDSITVLLKLPRVIIHFLTEFTLHYQPLDPQYFDQDTLKGYILTTHYKGIKHKNAHISYNTEGIVFIYSYIVILLQVYDTFSTSSRNFTLGVAYFPYEHYTHA